MRSSRNRRGLFAGAGLCLATLFLSMVAQGQETAGGGGWIVVRGTPAALKIWPKGRKLTDRTKVCIQGKGMLVLASTDGKRHRTYVGPGCNKVLKNGHLLLPNAPAAAAGAIR